MIAATGYQWLVSQWSERGCDKIPGRRHGVRVVWENGRGNAAVEKLMTGCSASQARTHQSGRAEEERVFRYVRVTW